MDTHLLAIAFLQKGLYEKFFIRINFKLNLISEPVSFNRELNIILNCINLQLPIIFLIGNFKHALSPGISNPQISVKSVGEICQNREHKMYLLKNGKLHKFAIRICKLISDMHNPTADL